MTNLTAYPADIADVVREARDAALDSFAVGAISEDALTEVLASIRDDAAEWMVGNLVPFDHRAALAYTRDYWADIARTHETVTR